MRIEKFGKQTKPHMEMDNLLARYFGGVASESDKAQLNAWIAESDENEAEFLRMTKLYELTGISNSVIPKFDNQQAKARFFTYISKPTTTKRIVHSYRWSLAIAAIAMLLLTTTFFWQFVTNDAIHIEAKGNELDVVLPDNSKVRLSANSTLQYASQFNKSVNEIELSGKASFEVAKQGSSTLRVKAGQTFIEDIGTVFEVSAYENTDFVQVKVSEGLVNFFSTSHKGVVVRANETAIYNKAMQSFVVAAKREIVNGNPKVVLNLDAISLLRAVDIIENAYEIKVNVPQALENMQITVSFVNEQPQTVLNIIAQTLGLKVEKSNGAYFFNVN